MTTHQIIKQMEKEFVKKARRTADNMDYEDYYEIPVRVCKHRIRTLLESFGEEIIGKNIRHVTASKGEKDHTGDVDTDEVINALQDDIDAVNDYKNEQRLKTKEIIEGVGK